MLFYVRAVEPIEIREVLLTQPEFSTNTYYGDSSPIEAHTLDELREAYEACSQEFTWEQGRCTHDQ